MIVDQPGLNPVAVVGPTIVPAWMWAVTPAPVVGLYASMVSHDAVMVVRFVNASPSVAMTAPFVIVPIVPPPVAESRNTMVSHPATMWLMPFEKA